MKKQIILCVMSICVIISGALQVYTQSSEKSALISIPGEQDGGTKIPLILIHGIHGTGKNKNVSEKQDYWNRFLETEYPSLREKYVVYLFQYQSDLIGVRDIAFRLGNSIDKRLADRSHVILAHSMGGLIAKSYMVSYRHLSGAWAGRSGGDTTLGLITLATPHHGTPGANDPRVLKNYFDQTKRETYLGTNFLGEIKFTLLNFIYWNKEELIEVVKKAKNDCFDNKLNLLTNKKACLLKVLLSDEARAISTSSLEYNRRDLRWDNYDGKITDDINSELAALNDAFRRYNEKVILYAGILKPVEPDLTLEAVTNNRSGLTFADGMLYFGLTREFRYTDGLVPYKSAMLCNFNPTVQHDFECDSPYRIRRFEFGSPNASARIPNPRTLSITKTWSGFNHEEMYKDQQVLEKVRGDLLTFSKAAVPTGPPIVVGTKEVPTMFLLDVSSSMSENDKITQAKNAGLSALKEMQENRRRGRDNSSVAISLFGGDCSPNNIRQILPYTSNLAQAETVFRSRIPNPAGLTPLYTAVDLTVEQMLSYLAARPALREGRIILLSDGENTCGEQIRPRGVYSQSLKIVYQQAKFLTIGFNIRPGSREERDLQYLASASNGKYYPARDGEQLTRVFQKAIRVYTPKSTSVASAEFERGVQAIIDCDFEGAIRIFIIYVRANPADPFGYYNLALACEAAERYKQAIENYKKHLQFAGDAADRQEIEDRIAQLEEDSRDETQYYVDLLRSDLDYLKDYYKRLFGLKNAELSAEFGGFVAEKGAFYRNLPQILEIRSASIERNSQELADSLDFLNRRVGLETFDRDAVSLLTSPISYLEELIDRIEAYNAQKR